jgi:hypothetical protein
MTNTINAYEIARVADPLVGKIEYLGNDGKVYDHTDYDDADTMIRDVKDELNWGVPIVITLYRNKKGKTISMHFINDLDCLPKGLKIEDAPTTVHI